MTPEFFNQAAAESQHLGLWGPILGVVILFLGMNMRVEIKIEKEEDIEKKD